MQLYFLQNIFTATGIQAVFTMLLHSLWLGVLLALLAGVVVMLTKRSGPQLRYSLLTGLLIVFVLSTGFIFCRAFMDQQNSTETSAVLTDEGNNGIQQIVYHDLQKSWADLTASFFESHADTIVWIWFIVISLKCLQLIAGLRGLYLLKHKQVTVAGERWNKTLCELSAKINLAKRVMLLQSSLAKIPMVIGYLKPVILFPVGLLNGLPQQEVEAILLHELAHIKRNDFLINLLQQFAEIIFFFNPAVLWVSSLIKNERENCCDDIALSINNDKKIFIHALVAFHEYNMNMPYATTFPGTKHQLLNRVKRIITNNNKTLNNMEKLILASGIILTSIAIAAFSPEQNPIAKTFKKEALQTSTGIGAGFGMNNSYDAGYILAEQATPKETDDESVPSYVIYDTVPQTKTGKDSSNIEYSSIVDGKSIRVTEVNNRIIELYVDAKKISEDQYAEYKPLVEKLHQQMKEEEVRLKQQDAMLKAKKAEMEKEQLEMKKQIEIMKQKQADMKVQSKKEQEDFLIEQKKFLQKQEEFKKKMQELKLQQQKMKTDTLVKPVINVNPKIAVKPAIIVKPKIDVQPKSIAKPVISVQPKISTSPSVSVKPVITNINSKVSVTPAVTTTSAVSVQPDISVAPAIVNSTIKITPVVATDDIIEELIKENIITNTNGLSYRLTNEELIVNSVKQPDAVHQKILKKFIKKPGDKINLSYDNNVYDMQ